MLKSSSLVLFLYTTLISIFFIRSQNTNRLIVLNDKPFPIFLSSSKNETHYFIITSKESLCIEIKTGNIERISSVNEIKKFYIFFNDHLKNDYIYYAFNTGYYQIFCCNPTFVKSNYQFNGFSLSVVGSMIETGDVIVYVYQTNYIHFLYVNERKKRSIHTELKQLTSCKILKNNVHYLCTCNNNYDKIIL